jgi:hypothetical protein
MQSTAIASSSSQALNADLASGVSIDTERAKRLSKLRFLSASFVLLAASCAHTSHDPPGPGPAIAPPSMATSSPSSASEQPMQTTQQNPSSNTAPMTAEEIGKRVLDLINTIKNASDISPENVEHATGLKINVNPENPSEYGAGGKITETWFYNLGGRSDIKGGKPNRLTFSFDDQTNNHADMTPVCSLDFDAYSKRLNEIGYQSSPVRGEHNRLSYWNFSRGDITVQVYVRGESSEKVNHDCVSMMIING